jgi:hypothetical protein
MLAGELVDQGLKRSFRGCSRETNAGKGVQCASKSVFSMFKRCSSWTLTADLHVLTCLHNMLKRDTVGKVVWENTNPKPADRVWVGEHWSKEGIKEAFSLSSFVFLL